MALQLPEHLEPHAGKISGDDPRFTFLPYGATLREALEQGTLDLREASLAVEVAGRILGMTIEDAVADLVRHAYVLTFRKNPTSAWAAALHARFGLSGAPATLQVAGDLAGVTRERVRQVTTRIEPLLRGCWMPQLDEALLRIVEHSPVGDPVGALLAPEGLARPDLRADSLLGIVDLLGVDVEQVTGTRLAYVDGWLLDVREEQLTDAVRVAAKHTSAYGMTTAEDVRQSLSTAQQPAGIDDVLRVLRASDNIRWAGDWLWFEKGEDTPYANTLVNQLRSMLSVNSPQTLASLHEGLTRNQKFRGRDVVPPPVAIEAFVVASDKFTLTAHGLVEPATALDYRQVHGPVAASMIDILKASAHQVMDRTSLMQASSAAGIAPATAGIWTTYAEWMARFGTGVWGLRGANPSPAVVTEIQRAAKLRRASEPSRLEWSWGADGCLVLTMDVTLSAFQSGTFCFDESLRVFTGGRSFAATGPDGTLAGEIRTSQDHAWTWGWGRVFTAWDAKPGDVVKAQLDLTASTATVSVGGQDLWI